MSRIRKAAIRFVQLFHLMMIFYLVLGGIFPEILKLLFGYPEEYFWFGITHITYLILILAHWKTNHGRCYLTDLEALLKGISPEEITPFTQRISTLSSHLGKRELDLKHLKVLLGLISLTVIIILANLVA